MGKISAGRPSVLLLLLLMVFVFVSMSWDGSTPEPEWKPVNSVEKEATKDVVNESGTCSWSFLRYQPSTFEEKWMETAKKNPTGHLFCEDLHSELHVSETYDLARTTLEFAQMKKPDSIKFHYYSKMIYKEQCDDGSSKIGEQLIEPLSGILRDPCDIFCLGSKCPTDLISNANGQSKQHMLIMPDAPFRVGSQDSISSGEWQYSVPPWHCRNQKSCSNVRATLMDMGASYFSDWNGNTAATAGGWFYERYHKRKYLLHNYYAYEAQQLNNAEAFKQVPEDLFPGYHWINVPVNAEVGHKLNPWTTLSKQRERNAYDVTIVKLDIDTPSIEGPLAEQLGARYDGSLVSEFFFEHHVNLEPLRQPWALPADFNITLYDSYVMFQNMRKKGIRSHSWP